MDQNMTSGKNVCRCNHHKAMPILVILLGLSFLLQAMGTLDAVTVGYIWPILLIIGGIMKLAGRSCGCCSK